MRKFDSALESLRRYLTETWQTTPVAWQNVAFDPEQPGAGFPSGGAYIHLALLPNRSRQASFGAPGSNLWVQEGRLKVEVYVPRGEGDGVALALVGAISDLLAGKRLGEISFSDAEIGGGENEAPGGRWWRRSVVLLFRHQQLA